MERLAQIQSDITEIKATLHTWDKRQRGNHDSLTKVVTLFGSFLKEWDDRREDHGHLVAMRTQVKALWGLTVPIAIALTIALLQKLF